MSDKKEDKIEAIAPHILQEEKKLDKLRRRIETFHTKNLFGLWFFLVLSLSICIHINLLTLELHKFMVFNLFGTLFFLVTGAYIYQEAARLPSFLGDNRDPAVGKIL